MRACNLRSAVRAYPTSPNRLMKEMVPEAIRSDSLYSMRSALIGSTPAARAAGTALAANATKPTPTTART